jgi:hypothetical protein
VGFGAGNFAPAYFANFEASPLAPEYVFAPVDRDDGPPATGTVTSWQVSGAFAEDELEDRLRAGLEWSALAAENSGVTNLARARGAGAERNTVVARLVLDSRGRQLKPLAFGYSDSVVVYLNGTPLYRGTNAYQSRDYRFLGTIGLFDTVYLPLEDDRNEVWFAVTEAFGGWGIQARFADLDGIALPFDSRRDAAATR